MKELNKPLPAGLLESVLEVAAKRRAIVGRLKEALQSNDDAKVIEIAKELCGVQQAHYRADTGFH